MDAESHLGAEKKYNENSSVCVANHGCDCERIWMHLHGGVVQGAGQVFGEKVVYDPETGQPLTASFMDYYMPRAGLIPEVRGEEHPTQSKVSPLGVKGVGESGCTASIPVLVGAVHDALRPLGVKPLDMPLTPAKLWKGIRETGV